LRIPLQPRSGALNLAVGFNPRDGCEMNLRVASATVESHLRSGSRGGFNRRWRDAENIHGRRGL